MAFSRSLLVAVVTLSSLAAPSAEGPQGGGRGGAAGRASEAIGADATRDDLASRVDTDDLGWRFTPQFFGQLYDELRAR